MPLLRSLLLRAAKEIATNPELRARAVEVIDREVKPRAQAAWTRTKPTLDAAKAELQDIAAETDPRDDPAGFARKVKERFVDGRKRH